MTFPSLIACRSKNIKNYTKYIKTFQDTKPKFQDTTEKQVLRQIYDKINMQICDVKREGNDESVKE